MGTRSVHTESVDERSEWYRERQAEWDATIAVLRAEGWTVKERGLAAPAQLEGQLPTGEPLYFRARWDEVSLRIGGLDPSFSPACEGLETYGSEFDASYLPAEDGLTLLRRLYYAYRSA
jgi:hypothetical protein